MKLKVEWTENVPGPADRALGPELELVQQSRRESVRSAIARLPQEFREALVLREIEGLAYKEIAAVLRVAPLIACEKSSAAGIGAGETRLPMTCLEAHPLLGARFDNELDLRTTLAVEEHLTSCDTCATQYRSLDWLREEVKPWFQGKLGALTRGRTNTTTLRPPTR